MATCDGPTKFGSWVSSQNSENVVFPHIQATFNTAKDVL